MERPSFLEDILEAFNQPKVVSLSAGYLMKRSYELAQKIEATVSEAPPLRTLLQNLKAKSPLTHYPHSLRVGLMYRDAAELYSQALEKISVYTSNIAGIAHDVGKISVPGKILEGKKLTPKQWTLMQAHNSLSYVLLKPLQNDYFPHLLSITMPHHPYPRGGENRRKEERRTIYIYLHNDRRSQQDRRHEQRREDNPIIQKAATILALCDQYDAMASKRSYKPALPEEQTRRILLKRFPKQRDIIDYLTKHYPLLL